MTSGAPRTTMMKGRFLRTVLLLTPTVLSVLGHGDRTAT
ncbi:hypothetical protein MP11Mi_14970 [Gordonia sp. MP11Mi]|uniref:Uncharacterized protein n=1 Tax=Gordonia sp. MP11Mi TaxID=3022769 RepID=A0AA97CU00_9ACTN